MEATEDDKGDAGGLPDYLPTGDDHQIQEVYRDRVHYNNGAHLIGRVANKDNW